MKISKDYQAFLDKIAKNLDLGELLDVMEASRRGLQDENMLEEMDVSETVAFEIVEKLNKKVLAEESK